jgi:hypothetical protein
MRFTCYEKKCPYDGKGSYTLAIPSEACVDEHNWATFFCPHCNGELTKMPLERGDYLLTADD